MTQSAGDKQPIGPVGIHENVSVRPLDEERGVTNPSDADLFWFELGKDGAGTVAMASFS